VERKPGDLEKKGRNTKEGESERRRPKKEGKRGRRKKENWRDDSP